MRTARVTMAAAAAAVALALLGAAPAQAAAAADDDPLHLFLHFTDAPGAAPENFDTAVRVGLQLQAEGFDVVDLRPVEATMRATTIRFFYPELRGAAYQLKSDLERLLALESAGEASPRVRVQDFTFYEPKPRPHSLEVWFGTRNAPGAAAFNR